MANDWPGAVDRVLGAAQTEFGENVLYTPVDGSPAFSVVGIYNNVWREVDPQSGTIVSSNQPNLGVRLSDFLGNVPIEGATFTIRSVAYKVTDVQEDGEGGAKCLLHKVAL